MISFLPIDRYYHLFGLKIPIWGTMAGISILLFLIAYDTQYRKYKLDPKHGFNAALHFGFWGLLGFHLYKIFFVSHSFDMLLNPRSGLDSFGVVFGFIALLIYLKVNKLNIRRYFDVIALPLIIAATTHRISCTLIGDKIGTVTNLSWGIYHKNALRHPIGFYYLVVSLIILIVMLYLNNKKLKYGNYFLFFVLLYCPTRFMLEFYRAWPPHNYIGLSVHQWAYGMLFIIGLALFWWNNQVIDKIRYRVLNFPTYMLGFFFPGGKGKLFFKIYVYFRWVDDIIDDENISKVEKQKFLKEQKQLLNDVYDRTAERYKLRYEEQCMCDVIYLYDDNELKKQIFDLMSTFEFDVKRIGKKSKIKQLMDYSQKIGAAYAYSFLMLFGLDKLEKEFNRYKPSSIKKNMRQICYDYAHYAHVVHMMRDYKKDKKAGYDNLPIEYKDYKNYFEHLIRYIKPHVTVAGKSIDNIRNLFLRFIVKMYYYRFNYVLERLRKKDYGVMEDYSSFKAFCYGLRCAIRS